MGAARADEDRELYDEYRRRSEGELLTQALRNAVLVFFVLQTFVFIPADWILFPDEFEFFLISRLALNALLCVVYFATSRPYPVASSAVVCFAGAALFMAMIDETGGASSGYYVGLILLVIGMGVLAPLSGKQGLFIASGLFIAYASLPFYGRDPVDVPMFSQHLFFLGAACLESVFACAYMDRMRFADFKQQREIERARDELAELDRAKSRFSANVHHELRTPLTLILAPLDALRSGEFGALSEEVERTLATMHTNGRRLYKMINNLLDVSRLESEQFTITRRPTDLKAIMEELVAGANSLAERKGVDLQMQIFGALPRVNIDAEAIEKVLVNLVGNALKFTERGDRIRVSAGLFDDEIRIAVSDSGIGIASDKLDEIFDRFAQLDGSATRRYEGTGIGLALAKEMVELHGGRIWAESVGEGFGTTMHVVLPLGVADEVVEPVLLEDESRASDAEERNAVLGVGHAIEGIEADLNLVRDRVGERDRGAERTLEMERSVDRWEDRHDTRPDGWSSKGDERIPEVLIAEDNPDMRDLLEMLIGKEFRVRCARNGREALEAMRERLPDLVLSDVMMPEISGLELCEAVKSDESMRAVPIVLVTSKAEREMKIEGLELGADDYVTKPFHPRELMARVRSLVRIRGLQKALAERNRQLERALDELQSTEVQLVQAERLAAVGELAAGIAHEVNNPVNFALNAVRTMRSNLVGVSELLKTVQELDVSDREGLENAARALMNSREVVEAPTLLADLDELADIVAEGLSRTHSLVGDLRDFAAPGKVGEIRASVDLERGLRSTIQLLGHSLGELRAEVELEVEPNLPRIQADAGAINQVLLNLVKNAAEALGPEGGRVRITLARSGSGVRLTVDDSGRGVTAETRERLFEPFFTTKDAGEGTGLGLSISHQIVRAHGGRLEYEPSALGGARFVVELPLTRPEREPPSEAPSA